MDSTGSEEKLYETRASLWLAVPLWPSAFVASIIVYHLCFQALFLIGEWYPPVYAKVEMWWIWLAILVPWLFAFWRTLEVYCTRYTITNQRLIFRTGVLSTTHDETELSRIRDFRVEEPFSLRVVGLGNLVIYSADPNMPTAVMKAQRHVQALRNELRAAVLERQEERGYREYEITSGT